MFTQAVAVRVVPAGRDQAENPDHVLGDRRIDLPKVGQVEAAISAGIPPSQKEIGDTAALAGVALGDSQQSMNRVDAAPLVRHAATLYCAARLIAGLGETYARGSPVAICRLSEFVGNVEPRAS